MDCAGSRVTTGNHPALLALEAKVGEFLGGRETALCSGGYLANTVALEAVAEDYQHFFLDASAHASVATPAEGMPRKALHRFRAQDPEDLARQLKRHLRPGDKPLVLTDGVVSGYGQVPPLKAYREAVRDLGGRLLVDDSHGVAVLGATGKGSPEEAGLPPQAFLQTGTLSKGFGLFGGFVAGDPGMMEKVAGRSRAFVGATPIPPFLAAAAVRAIGIVQEHPELIATLQARAVAMSRRLSALGFPVSGTRAPIFSVTYRDEARNRRLGEILERYGIYPHLHQLSRLSPWRALPLRPVQRPHGRGSGAPAPGHRRFPRRTTMISGASQPSALRIQEMRVHRFDLPLREVFTIATMSLATAQNLLVELRTNQGLTGWGEASPFRSIVGETQIIDLAAAHELKPLVEGCNPLEAGALMDQLEAHLPHNSTLKSAVDMALFDLAAQACGQPLYAYLGGRRRPMETDLTIGIGDPEQAGEKALAYLAEGFRMIKVKLGLDARADLRRLENVRRAVGPDRWLRIDANQGWDRTRAIRNLRALSPWTSSSASSRCGPTTSRGWPR